MQTLRRASIGYLWRHPWQLGLALLGIVIGVAVIVAVDIANNSARTAFGLSMDAVTGKATHQIIGGPGGIPDSLYTELRVERGFDRLAPVIQGSIELQGKRYTLLGIDPFAERDFRSFAGGNGDPSQLRRLLSTHGSVLMSPAAAASNQLAAGDRFSASIDGQAVTAILGGIFSSDRSSDSATKASDSLVIADMATAQDWLQMQGLLSRIDVIADTPQRVAALEASLPAALQLLPAEGRSAAVVALSDAFAINLQAMSLLALLVGVFLIYNSVSFAVLQRRPLFATLRALGITRRQVVGLVLAEGLALGVVGAALGIVVGIVLGSELLVLVSQSINDLYFRLTVTTVDVQWLSVTKGLMAGIGATGLASLVPAVEAASCPPGLARQRRSIEQRSHQWLPRLLLAGLCLVVLAFVVLAMSGDRLAAGLLALFLLVIGLALCIPKLVYSAGQLLSDRRVVPGGALWRAALAGIGASISRTGVAIVALAVAVSATIGVSIMVGSFRLAVSDWLDGTLQADFYLAAAEGTLPPEMPGEVASIDGIDAVSSSRRVWLESSAGRTRLIALQMAPQSYRGTELLDGEAEDVWDDFHQRGAVLVSESYAYQQGLQAGDVVRLPTALGPRAFRIAARYRSYDANPAAVIMDRQIYDTFWNDDAVDALGIYLANNANAEQVALALRTADTGRALELRSNRDLRQLSLRIFDRTFIITNVLYWLAIAVALVGILAAMLALQMERGRELATLRALGVTRLQLGVSVSLQSAMIGLWSGLAAIPLGLTMAWLLIDVINRRAFGWSMDIAVLPADLYSAVALSVAAALVAGIFPAWRSATGVPAAGMRDE